MSEAARKARVEVVPDGLLLRSADGVEKRVPLLVGSLHYWHHPVDSWRPLLEAVRDLGVSLIDTYVPWSVHEVAPGVFDFGSDDPRKDLARFLREIDELGLYCIARPGPHVNAELTRFGIPERVIWNEACQARGPDGSPVVLPMLPLSFPAPSYASAAYQAEVAGWYEEVAPRLARYQWPAGPIVVVQVDNEGSYTLRDGPYDQDYHADSVSAYRDFLREKYADEAALRFAYEDAELTFATVEPPVSAEDLGVADLPRHIDWVAAQERSLADAIAAMKVSLQENGIQGVAFSHNLPPGEAMCALDPELLERSMDLLGVDYYHPAAESHRRLLCERTSELTTRADATGTCSYAAEMGVGCPPFFPPLDAGDSLFTALCAVAYGLRGMNLYMAVDRDRWIGAALGPGGEERPTTARWRELLAAMRRLEIPRLHRDTPVHVVVPRSLRQLWRVQHAWGPVTASAFEVMTRRPGQGLAEGALAAESGALESWQLFAALLDALEARGVPYSVTPGHHLEHALETGRWVVVLCPGTLEAGLQTCLEQAKSGHAVSSVGPCLPHGLTNELLTASGLPERVARAINELKLPQLLEAADGVQSTLLADDQGQPRAVGLINAEKEPRELSVPMSKLGLVSRSVSALRDSLSGEVVPIDSEGRLEVELPPRTVRLFELVPAQSSENPS